MQRHYRTLFIGAIGLVMLTGMGCERMKAMGGGGATATTINAQPEDVVEAAANAVDEHRGLVLVSDQATELGGRVVARTVEDNPFRIQVTRESRGISRVSIDTANQGLAYDVMDQIREDLGMDRQGQRGQQRMEREREGTRLRRDSPRPGDRPEEDEPELR